MIPQCPQCGTPMQAVNNKEYYFYCPDCGRTNYDNFDPGSLTLEDLADAERQQGE